MTPKNLTALLLSFVSFLVIFTGCEKLGNGVVQEIEFPTHTPQLAVTLITKPITDTLVARAYSSAGILDTSGSQRLKSALFTLSHENGASFTWGGQTDWVNGIGHLLQDVNLEPGLWTLQCEEENFETATASQVVPPQIDSLGDYAYTMTSELTGIQIDEYGEGCETKYFLSRDWTLELQLPDRESDRDFFVLKSQALPSEDDDEFWENSTWISPAIEDDARMTYNDLAEGLIIEDLSGVNSLNSLRFNVYQFNSGYDLDALEASIPVLELAAISAELAEYYRTLDLINNPSAGGLFTEPLLAFSNVSSGFGCFGLYTSCNLVLNPE